MEMTNGMQLTYSNYSNLNLGGERKEIHKKKKNVKLAARGDFGRIVSHLRVSMPGRNRRSSLRSLIKFPESSRVHPIIEY
jgi:hypothetical protein